MNELIIGIDIGGTSVKIGFIRDEEIAHKWEITTNKDNQGASILFDIWNSIEIKLEQMNIDKKLVIGIGVGAPGFIDSEQGIIHQAVNIGWKNFYLVEQLKNLAQLPVFLTNDANAAALGEHWTGAGNGAENMIAITLGTGVGSGLIVNGQIVNGVNGAAGEIGHILVDPEGARCNCGRIGCLETIVSATGIVRQATEMIKKHPNNDLANYYKENTVINAKAIFDLANKGNAMCKEIIEKTANTLGLAIANMATMTNPSIVLIGGGVAKAGDDFLKLIRTSFNNNALSSISSKCTLKLAKLGNDAGVFGAAYLVKQHGSEVPL